MLYWRAIDKMQVDPQLVADLEETLGPDPGEWYVTCGFRSIEVSNIGYAAYRAYLDGHGPRAPKFAPGGKSPHNFGLAVDLALDGDPVTPRLQPDWDEAHPAWIRLRGLVDAHPRLHGGWWFQDSDHVEVVGWKEKAGLT